MNFKVYFRDSIWRLVYFFLLVLIINSILILSNPISESIEDIIYLNILIDVISLTFFIFGYYRWKSNYFDYKYALDNKKDLVHALPEGTSFGSKLVRDTIKYKDEEIYEKTEKLHTLLEEINDYIIQWVHEIKIPIAVCELISDKLSELSTLDDGVKISEDLRIELERIKFLIDQVLYASRASSYSEDLSIEEVSLEKIIKDSIKKNASFFISKKISIDLVNLNYNVMTDKKWISYILGQLLNNSYKYLNEKGEIQISAVEDDKSIKLMIKDTGIGIQPKDIDRIFHKGFTGDNGRLTTRSTGMGLYYSKKMIDKLGHSIFVSSEPNRFTKFTIVFYKLSDYLNVTKL